MINPFYAGDDVEHKRTMGRVLDTVHRPPIRLFSPRSASPSTGAQHSTLASIEHAAALARAQSISVEVTGRHRPCLLHRHHHHSLHPHLT